MKMANKRNVKRPERSSSPISKIKERRRVVGFLTARLEDSLKYDVRKITDTGVLVAEKTALVETPRVIDVVLANGISSAKDFEKRYRENARSQVYTAPILYKDGITAFVRMVERNPSWINDKSLKNYTSQQINQMLHLRKIEKTIMTSWGKVIQFYQPETERLQESIRDVKLDRVLLDYSHIDPSHDAADFVSDRWSVDYKLPEDVSIILRDASVGFKPRPDHYWRGKLERVTPAYPEDPNGQLNMLI